MKNATIVILAIVVLGVAAILFSQSKPSQDNGQMQVTITGSPTKAAEATGAMQEGKVHEISMTAKQWDFEPSTITVKEGEKVRLKINNIDVDHGIAIPEFNVNATLEPGKETTVEFVASKKGEFTFFCSVVCGRGHREMTGKLIVE